MAKVKFSVGRTYNLGNYESLRFDVGLEDDAPNNESVKGVLDEIKEFCIGELNLLEKEHGISGKS